MNTIEFLGVKIKEFPLRSTHRGAYLKDTIKYLINSYPPETPITDKEIQVVCSGYVYTSVRRILHKMIKQGEISREKRRPGVYTYKVLIEPEDYTQEIRAYELTNKPERIPYRGGLPDTTMLDQNGVMQNGLTQNGLTQNGLTQPQPQPQPHPQGALEDERELSLAFGETLYTLKQLERIAIKLEFYSEHPKLHANELLMHLKNMEDNK